MTIKDLKQAIANLPDDGEVYVQRIEDFYFTEEGGWSVKSIEGEEYHRVKSWKDKGIAFVDADLYKEQYIDTHCCIDYDGKNLYITSHY